MFQRRIMGLVSYYSGSDKQLFADKNFNIVELEMHPCIKKYMNILNLSKINLKKK